MIVRNSAPLWPWLLALIVLGLTSVALIVAFSTTLSASAQHRTLASANLAIRLPTAADLGEWGYAPALFLLGDMNVYQRTHDPKYLAMGQTFFDSLMKYCRTDTGFAALSDVRTKQKTDSMESFFFAETMKYLYLIFAPPATVDFDSIVFNTEAHPLKRNFVVTPTH